MDDNTNRKDNAYRQNEQRYWNHYGVTPTEKWLNLNTLNTQVRVLEIGQGEPLLFVHGGPSAGSTFAPLAAHLTDFRCLVLDRPGCGLSPPIRYTGLPHNVRMPNLLAACLDALELPYVNLVGSSFGGACALWLALRHPQRVKKIVLMGCPPFINGTQMPLFLRLLATPVIGQLLCRLPANRSGSIAYLNAMGQQQTMKRGHIPDAFFDWHISLGRDTRTMCNEHQLVQHGLTFRGMRPELIIADAQLQSLPHPLYVYWGAHDPLADAEFARKRFASMKQAALDVLPDSGHLPWLDDPNDAARRTRHFLTSAVIDTSNPIPGTVHTA